MSTLLFFIITSNILIINNKPAFLTYNLTTLTGH